jgi:dihydrofolate synthase/folylpolyglutamate synthase
VITSISFDHTQLLGDTLEAIAREKAGIIKPATPVILGALSPGPQGVVESVAAPLGAPLRSLGRDFRFDYRPPERLDIAASRGLVDFVDDVSGGFGAVEGVEVGLVGPHQAANAAVALAALGELRRQGWSIPESAAREGLAGVRWPARMEVVRRAPAIVVDAAHNVASIEALLATLDQSFSARRRLAIFATSRDKDARGMLQLLLPRFDRLLLSRYTTNPRGAPIDELLNISQQIAAGNEFQAAQVAAFPNLAAAWDAARAWLGPEDLAVVTGSFYTAGEMLTLIRK